MLHSAPRDGEAGMVLAKPALRAAEGKCLALAWARPSGSERHDCVQDSVFRRALERAQLTQERVARQHDLLLGPDGMPACVIVTPDPTAGNMTFAFEVAVGVRAAGGRPVVSAPSTSPDAHLALKPLATYGGLGVRTLRGYLHHVARPRPRYNVGGKILAKHWQFRMHACATTGHTVSKFGDASAAINAGDVGSSVFTFTEEMR